MNFDFFLDLFNQAMMRVVQILEFGFRLSPVDPFSIQNKVGFRLSPVDPFSIQNKGGNKNPMDLWSASSGPTLGN